MPPKVAAATSNHNLTAKEVEMLAALVTLMGEVPSIDYEALAGMVGIKLGKNARQSVRNIFKKLQSQRTGATAGPSSAPTAKTNTPETDDNEADEECDEKKSPKKPIAKKGIAAKKAVGKTTTPKKTGAGGPKVPAKGKGKVKRAMLEEAEAEAEAEGEDGVTAAKTVSGDEEMQVEDGKLPQSLTSINDAPPPVASEASLSVVINGEVVVYTPRDIEVAKSHEVALVDYLIWKSSNNYEFYVNGYQNNSASQGALKISDKV